MDKNPNKQNIQSLSRLGRQFSDTTILMHEAIAKKVGLTSTDHTYLGFLIRNGAMTAGELSKFTGLTTGAITGLIDRLEQKKFVKREFDKNDRRKIIIVPDIENTMKQLGSSYTDLHDKMANLISTLSDNEVKIIEKYFISTIDILKEITSKLIT